MDNEKKNTPKILTTNDIRKHARDWTLAGDVGLLAYLEQFSESIINKTEETQKNFNELVSDYKNLYAKVGNTTNQFLALQNCQFVENRVYDEETPTEEKTEIKEQNEAEQEKLLLMQYKEAVEVGIKLLDTHFQEVQLPPNSDSDEDEISAGNSVIWKPKNPYANKKFPLLIGSSEWWEDDFVGLGTNEEILDTEKIVSESESDLESLRTIEKSVKTSSSSSMENIKAIPKKQAFLESSSEDLFGFDKNDHPKSIESDDLSKNSNFVHEAFLPNFDKEPETEAKKKNDSSDNVNHSQDQGNEKTSEDESRPIKPNKIDNAFMRELMAKLVSVTSNSGERDKEKQNGKNQEKVPERKFNGTDNLFDETDDSSDLFSTRTKEVPVKCTQSKGLFSDIENDDELFKSESGLFSDINLFKSDGSEKPESQPFEKNDLEVSSESVSSKKKEMTAPLKKNLVNDLFDDLDDGDPLFASEPVISDLVETSLLPEENSSFKEAKIIPSPGLDWDNDDALFENTYFKTGSNFLKSSGLYDAEVNEAVESKVSIHSKNKNSEPDLFSKELGVEGQSKNNPEDSVKKETSVFDSDIKKIRTTEDFSDDPFGFSVYSESTKKKISILDSDEEDDLFSKSFKEKKPSISAMTLPDDNSILFGEQQKPSDSLSMSSSRSSLFDDVSSSKSRLASVFEKEKGNKAENKLLVADNDFPFVGDAKLGKNSFSAEDREKDKSALFDDCDDTDDLFGEMKKDVAKQELIFEKSLGVSVENLENDIFEEDKKQVRGVKSSIDNIGSDDLFKKPEVKMNLRETKSDVLRRSEQKLFADDLDDADLFSDKTAKVKPPSSLSLKTREPELKSTTVGKLNIPDNLKVRFESAAKQIAAGGIKISAEDKKTEEDKEEVLDVPLQPSALLKCPSKDRVKIPGRRRPQSRRARQEAIRSSGTWDRPISPPGNSNASQPSKDSFPSPAVSNPLSPSTDEEDFFKVPELDTNYEKEDQSIFKSDLFESSKSSKSDDNLLFDGAPVLSPLSLKNSEDLTKVPESSLFGSVKPRALSIFDDEGDKLEKEEDENLFKFTKPPTGDSVLFRLPVQNEKKVKKPLFDPDFDDEEDDLFRTESQVTPLRPSVVEKSKGNYQGKDKGNFVDPLGLMTKNEK